MDSRVSFGFTKATKSRGKTLSCENKFQLKCSVDRDMDLSTSAISDGVADCVNGLCGSSFVVVVVVMLHI